MPNNKKSFKSGAATPTSLFISKVKPADEDPADNAVATEPAQLQTGSKPVADTASAIPAGYKLDPKYIEKRTERLQLVLQPSLAAALKAAAKSRGVSVNELVNSLLKAELYKEEQ